jgi:hypothetical protein
MIAARPGQLGSTRVCPHCKATILETAIICPGCKHHLRFGSDAAAVAAQAQQKLAWQVEGTLHPEAATEGTEYTIVIAVRNEKNVEIARQVVNVGSLLGEQMRSFTLSIETSPPRTIVPTHKR